MYPGGVRQLPTPHRDRMKSFSAHCAGSFLRGEKSPWRRRLRAAPAGGGREYTPGVSDLTRRCARFGPATKKAVADFQRLDAGSGLGSVGPKTREALEKAARDDGPGKCATGVSNAIQNAFGFKVWGNGDQLDNNLPRDTFKQVHMPLSEALKTPGLVHTWEKIFMPTM